MHWIALQWSPDPALEEAEAAAARAALPSAEALGWWALQFTPRAVWLDEALLLEVSVCERLWGDLHSLLLTIGERNPGPLRVRRVQGATSLEALARLRLFAAGMHPPARVPADLPLHTLSAAREHASILERMGCRTWGDVAALPRAGLARRFGTELREALDIAWGQRPEQHRWLLLPEVFDHKVELPALAKNAEQLMWAAARLLEALQIWLRSRQSGVLAFELQWTLDLRRLNGVALPPHEQLVLRTAEPVQSMAHLKRLLAERLAHTRLAAPASWLRLRSLETAPLPTASASFLPDESRKGDRLHEMVERLTARLGADQVHALVPCADHRPEAMQCPQPARERLRTLAAPLRSAAAAAASRQPDALYPPWLLPEPERLEGTGMQPRYRGPLRLLSGPQRLKTGWWVPEEEEGGNRAALRDYYIAESPEAGLVWIFQERSRSAAGQGRECGAWYLQGLYA
ncbi:MAG: DNA polymerase Y family protein [Pseudomonadota bacterium]